MKKKKKQSDKKIIKNLNSDLASKDETISILKNTIASVKRIFWGSGSYNYADTDIVGEIQELINYRKTHEGSIDRTMSIIEEENMRLWYLIRSITGDKTLNNEVSNHVDYRDGSLTPFKKPHF